MFMPKVLPKLSLKIEIYYDALLYHWVVTKSVLKRGITVYKMISIDPHQDSFQLFWRWRMLTINLALPEAQVCVPDELDPREGKDTIEDGLWLHPEQQTKTLL